MSEAAGVQRLTAPARSAYPHFIDATGDTIIGQYPDDRATRPFRWSAATGTTEIDGDARGRIALDGDVLVLPGAAGPEVSRFEAALAPEALPVLE